MSGSSGLARQLADGQSPVYLLHGDEAFLTRRAFAWLRGRVLAGALEDFNLDRFDARERPPVERIVEAARTLPMMAERRMVWVRNAEALFAEKAGGNLEPLLAYLESPDPSTCLVLVAMRRVDKRSALYKRIQAKGTVLESATPRERELGGWVVEQARARGRTLTPDAAEALVAAVGRDLASLDAAVERLSLFVEGDTPIGVDAVEQVVSQSRVRTVWELVDAVADRNVAVALARAHELMGQGEPALKLLSLIARQFRQLLVGRSARAAGAAPDACAAAAGVPPFRARSFVRQLGNYTGRELLEALERLAQADRALKSSKLADELVLEGMLLDLCRPRSTPR